MGWIMLKPICGFPDYFIDKKGNVYSLKPLGPLHPKPKKPRVVKASITHGYAHVLLHKDGKAYNKRNHRLVLETFVGPCPSGLLCRHLNGNRLDNRLCNLIWGTPKENAMDMIRHGNSVRGERNPLARLTRKDVIKIRQPRGLKRYADIARDFGIAKSTVTHIMTKRNWSWVV